MRSICQIDYITLDSLSVYINLIIIDSQRVSINILQHPRNDFLVRAIDKNFVSRLKLEMMEWCSTFAKPLIAMVRGLTPKTDFDIDKIVEYGTEVIGGNHRREAYEQLML